MARRTATVLAFGIAVRILRHVFVAVVFTALLTCAKLHHFEVLGRRMVAVLASQVSGGRRRTVFLALAPGTLPPLDSLYVLHLASTGVHTRAASREFPYSELTQHTLRRAHMQTKPHLHFVLRIRLQKEGVFAGHYG